MPSGSAISTANDIGTSIGVSAAGIAIDHAGAVGATTAGGVALAFVAAAVLVTRGRLDDERPS